MFCSSRDANRNITKSKGETPIQLSVLRLRPALPIFQLSAFQLSPVSFFEGRFLHPMIVIRSDRSMQSQMLIQSVAPDGAKPAAAKFTNPHLAGRPLNLG